MADDFTPQGVDRRPLPRSAQGPGQRAVWPWIAILAGVALLIPLYAAALPAPAAGIFHDDGIYIVTAKALAEGRGYSLISLPDEIRQTKYPPLFPFLLSLAWIGQPNFPENIPYLRLVPFGCFLFWCWFTYCWLRDSIGAAIPAASIVLLAASGTWTWFLANSMLSEMPFVCLMSAAVAWFGVDRSQDSPRIKWAFGLAALVSAAWLTRAPGMILVGAGAWVFLVRKQFLVLGCFLAGVLAAMLPWHFWVATAAIAPNEFYDYYGIVNYSSQNAIFDYSFADKLKLLGTNIGLALAGLPLSFGWLDVRLVLLGTLAFLPLFFAGIFSEIRRGFDFKLAILVLSLAAYLTRAWVPTRFLSTLIPFALYYCYQGMRILLMRRLPPRFAWLPPAVLASVVFAVNLLHLRAVAAQIDRTGIVWPTAYDGESWSGIQAAAEFVAKSVPPEKIVFSEYDPLIYLLAGHKSIWYFRMLPFEHFYGGDPQHGAEFLDFSQVDRERPVYVVNIHVPATAARRSCFLHPVALAAWFCWNKPWRLRMRFPESGCF
jgi:hypothetical protein